VQSLGADIAVKLQEAVTERLGMRSAGSFRDLRVADGELDCARTAEDNRSDARTTAQIGKRNNIWQAGAFGIAGLIRNLPSQH